MALKFEDPPNVRAGRKGTKWREIFAELRTRPDEWALVADAVAASTVSSIQSGRYGNAKPGEFEATGRGNGDGTYRIYARYSTRQ